MGAKKLGKKAKTKYTFCHWWEYYLNKLGKFKLPNHVKSQNEKIH